MKLFGATMQSPLPPFYTVASHFCVAFFTLDFTFYWAHRWFHTPVMYRLFHKKHHEYKWTIGFAAEWAHPVEHILANQATMAIAMVLLGAHGFTWFVWLTWRLIDTYIHHSGFDFPLIGDGGVHDFHHTNNVGSYSSDFMDSIFGTNTQWLAKLAKEDVNKQK